MSWFGRLKSSMGLGFLCQNRKRFRSAGVIGWWLLQKDRFVTFVSNNTLLAGGKSVLDWRFVGPSYWSKYQSSIQQTTSVTSVTDAVTVAGGSYPGSSGFRSSILMADGRVFLVPYNSTTARIYDPVTNTTSTPLPTFPGPQNTYGAFYGGVLMRDGRLFLTPFGSTTARIYDPATDTLTTPSGTYTALQYMGGLLLPDGRVFVPSANGNVVCKIYDPVSDTTTDLNNRNSATQSTALLPNGDLLGSSGTTVKTFNYTTGVTTTVFTSATTLYHRGFVHLSDGRVFLVPSTSSTPAMIYDPNTNSVAQLTTIAASGNSGLLLPNGKVFITPSGGSSSKATIYDPVANTFAQTTSVFSATIGASVLMRDGRVFCTPYNGTTAFIFGGGGGFNLNVAQSTYLNKL